MKKRFVFSIILLCVLVSVCISGCDEQMTSQMDILVDTVTDPSSGEPEVLPDGMVLIPAGEFEMGSNDAEASADEQPVHTVYVDAFYMDKYEVTNAQYAAFLNAKGKHAEAGHTWWENRHGWARIERVGGVYRVKAGYEDHPVTFVSWHGAMAYAAWAGKRLPTEAEWEKAARGGLAGRKYPWGDTIDSSKANYNPIRDTTAVGSYPANGYGLYDMAGNVQEWCLDEYDADFYAGSPRDNPFSGGTIADVINNFTNIETRRVVRGGCWGYIARHVRVASRRGWTPTGMHGNDGFRCVRAVARPPAEDGTQGGGTIPDGMVLIPAGEFEMGSNDPASRSYEKPVHSVYVDAFYMDEHQVTNVQYAAFLTAKGKHADAGHTWLDIGDGDERIERVGGVYRAIAGYENHPVVEVSWYGAMAYAAWQGKRLPTDAEWEKAARGGLSGQKYPWGDTIDSSQANYNRNVGNTTVVGRYPANGYGLHDMVGNVWEWCLDEYVSDFYARSPRDNPFSGGTITDVINNFIDVSSERVFRGGAWYHVAQDVRVAYRHGNPPAWTAEDFGFRCVRAVTP